MADERVSDEQRYVAQQDADAGSVQSAPTEPESEPPLHESDEAWRGDRLSIARPDDPARPEGARPGEGAIQNDFSAIRGVGHATESLVDLDKLRAWKRRVFLGGPRSGDWEEFDQIIADGTDA
jgi:hypothetical protein